MSTIDNGHSHLLIFVPSETKKTIQSIPTIMSIPNNPISGWWYTYPSEKYEFVRLDHQIIIPTIGEIIKKMKPATRISFMVIRISFMVISPSFRQ